MTAAVPTPEFVELLAIVRGYQRSQTVRVAAELGLADLLGDGPLAVEDLAVATSTQTEALYRLLRALASIGIFDEGPHRRFGLTPVGGYLRSDHPLSVSPVARYLGADYEWKAWGELLHSVRTGENAAVHALGVDVWQYRSQHPEANEVFNAAMRTLSSGDGAGLLAAHDFGRHRVIADIGGGTGAALASILQANPSARGILFDQPQVVADAGPVLERAGVADRVEVVGGSFFEAVPSGADAYLLRRVLHDWEDDKAATILRTVRACMSAHSRLLVADGVVGAPNEDPLVAEPSRPPSPWRPGPHEPLTSTSASGPEGLSSWGTREADGPLRGGSYRQASGPAGRDHQADRAPQSAPLLHHRRPGRRSAGATRLRKLATRLVVAGLAISVSRRLWLPWPADRGRLGARSGAGVRPVRA